MVGTRRSPANDFGLSLAFLWLLLNAVVALLGLTYNLLDGLKHRLDPKNVTKIFITSSILFS